MHPLKKEQEQFDYIDKNVSNTGGLVRKMELAHYNSSFVTLARDHSEARRHFRHNRLTKKSSQK
ncbi:hypothetical protein [Burkholderia contaminans]|uniref:hypothetical protein n=1 Tax=Burkholderia contaminans TaxID=488447 RepID=UPI003D67F058